MVKIPNSDQNYLKYGYFANNANYAKIYLEQSMIVFHQNKLPNNRWSHYIGSPRGFKYPNVDQKITPNIGNIQITSQWGPFDDIK
jgi:hypothetical protein